MARTTPSFFRRIGLAFSVLFGAELAGRLVRLRDEAAAADAEAEASAEVGAEEAAAPARPAIVHETTPEAALQLLVDHGFLLSATIDPRTDAVIVERSPNRLRLTQQ